MSNMSYCRFYNTYHDLIDCVENLEDSNLSDEEAEMRFNMLVLMVDTVQRYGLLDDDNLESFNPENEENYRYYEDEGEDDFE